MMMMPMAYLHALVHELVDDAPVGEQLGGGAVVDALGDVLKRRKRGAHLEVDDGAALQRRLVARLHLNHHGEVLPRLHQLALDLKQGESLPILWKSAMLFKG